MSLSQTIPPPSILRACDLFFRTEGINYCLIGGMAVNIHAVPRGTEDVDILVQSLPDEAVTRSQNMRRFGFYPSKSHSKTHLILDRDDGYVECLLANDDLRSAALLTATLYDVMGMQIKVVAPDFLIALKLTAISNNPKRFDKDSQDILATLIAKKPDLSRIMPFLSSTQLRVLEAISNFPRPV